MTAWPALLDIMSQSQQEEEAVLLGKWARQIAFYKAGMNVTSEFYKSMMQAMQLQQLGCMAWCRLQVKEERRERP